MERFAPYIEFAIALAVGAALILFANPITTVPAPADAKVPTLTIVPNLVLPTISLPNLVPQEAILPTPPTQTQSSAVATKKAATTTPPTVPDKATIIPDTTVASTSVGAALPAVEDAAPYSVAPALRTALVNIICYAPRGSGLHSISASGITIDSKGIILTNAHVAQYFLFTDRGIDCRVRTGGPAIDAYRAALIYISPLWLRANASVVTEASPTGTGENDFALLAVTSSIVSSPLPDRFPYVPLATESAITGDRLAVASYGGEFLAYDQVRSALYPTVVFSRVEDLFTFAVDTIDVIALGGSSAAQEGSSGGGVADASGKLVATLTTSTTEGDTRLRSLHAITAPYIRREYVNETSQSLDTLLAQPTASSIANFALHLPSLEAIVTAQLH